VVHLLVGELASNTIASPAGERKPLKTSLTGPGKSAQSMGIAIASM
jgi:hypothetical protein